MGKGDRKAAHNRKPGKRTATGRLSRAKVHVEIRREVEAIERDPQRTALEARCRHMGKEPSSRENRNSARSQMLEGPIGMMLHIGIPHGRERDDEIRRIWSVWHGLTSAQAGYARRYLGINLHARGANLQSVPEMYETRPDEQTDTRTPEEKDCAAVINWMRWERYLGCLMRSDHVMIQQAARGVGPVLTIDGKMTDAGRLTLAAFGRLADVVDRLK